MVSKFPLIIVKHRDVAQRCYGTAILENIQNLDGEVPKHPILIHLSFSKQADLQGSLSRYVIVWYRAFVL